MSEPDPKIVAALVARLSSEDSFERLGAIEELSRLTKFTFGFRFNDPPADRELAIRRWSDWLKEQKRRRERKQQLQAAVQLTGGVIDLSALKKAIEEIPAEQIQGYLQNLLAKMKDEEHRCDACHQRAATVHVTELKEGNYKAHALCETCARERGDVLG
jgi:hypothetical protein